MKRVVITGIGPVTPIGIGRDELWRNAVRGRSGTSALTDLPLDFPIDTLRSRVVARVPLTFDGGEPRQLSLARHAARLAMRDAGLTTLAGDGSAVVVATAVAATTEMEAMYLALWDREGDDALHETRAAHPLVPLLSFHTMAHELAAEWQCDGMVLTSATGCTAGLDAIGVAFELIRGGDADIILAGAAEAPITPVVFAAFDVIGALTRQNHRPANASRPFDAARDGFILGEGAAMLVLEERQHALARGAHVYSEITGFASLSNGYHMTDLPADGSALAECIVAAMDDAALFPDDVDHVNAHGSSTPQNDVCETNAVKRVLGSRARDITVTASKSMTGHALGASNAIEIAACALSLERGFVLPTINFDCAGDGCDLDYVPNHARPALLRNLLKLSNGFSGIHSVMTMAAP
ncbi:MAG TPA: beta-ketoacyl-[acyl-carrier-protein] synthase family protein [Thermoanaerobaculia bacterium]|jgi:3-oxoacyl-(acyl-carrier-protein) synthase|nr:beta-ketoacyl-[acyl-carrier-protein] synthase family protein [Thermoanaerobaculia bacterium]